MKKTFWILLFLAFCVHHGASEPAYAGKEKGKSKKGGFFSFSKTTNKSFSKLENAEEEDSKKSDDEEIFLEAGASTQGKIEEDKGKNKYLQRESQFFNLILSTNYPNFSYESPEKLYLTLVPNRDVKFSLNSLRYGKLKDFDNQQRCALRTERKEGKETKEIRNYRLTKGKAFSVKEIHYTKKIYFDHYSWSSGAWRISFLGRKGEKSLVLVCPYGESTLGKLKEWLSHSFEMKFVNLPVEELETESYRSEAESDTDSDDFETGSEDDQDEQPKKKAQVSTSSAASSGLRKRKPRSAFKTADADGKKSSHSEKEKET